MYIPLKDSGLRINFIGNLLSFVCRFLMENLFRFDLCQGGYDLMNFYVEFFFMFPWCFWKIITDYGSSG